MFDQKISLDYDKILNEPCKAMLNEPYRCFELSLLISSEELDVGSGNTCQVAYFYFLNEAYHMDFSCFLISIEKSAYRIPAVCLGNTASVAFQTRECL